MQENIKKTRNEDVEPLTKKRKIVHRIVRRVPKPKAPIELDSSKISGDEVIEFSAKNEFASKVVRRERELNDILANEEPIKARGDDDLMYDENESRNPREMILKELGNTDSQNNSISHHNLNSRVKDTSNTIWPYLSKTPKNNKEEKDYHIKGDDSDQDNDSHTEHNYFSWIPWVIIPLIVTGIVVFGLSYFAGAEVVVTPKIQKVVISNDVTTEKDGDINKSLPLTVLIIEDKVTNDVAATEAKTTIATASGKVTIFNKQKIVQTLIKTTRLESSDGKIYRIRENIKVPASVNDKPGSIDVMVYAESAGPDYNKKSGVDFTVPGFKGKPQFQLVYAKSITDIEGGSSGVKKSVSKETMEELSKSMRIELENKLRARVSRELIQNQVSYEGLYQFDYKEATLESSDAPEKARIAMSGTLSVPVFDKNVLSREFAKLLVENYAGEDLVLNKIEQLTAKLAEGQKIDLLKDTKAIFHFEGEATFVWLVDSASFSKALLNISKEDVSRVSKRFTGIDKVTATLQPFWKNYFPGNINDIKIKIEEIPN